MSRISILNKIERVPRIRFSGASSLLGADPEETVMIKQTIRCFFDSNS